MEKIIYITKDRIWLKEQCTSCEIPLGVQMFHLSSKKMNAAQDFMMLLVHAHIIAATETIKSKNAYENVAELARAIVSSYIRLSRINDTNTCEECDDKGHLYVVELLSLGMIWYGLPFEREMVSVFCCTGKSY